MAKWGEGDPRWIVEERPDAVNVNNWHWTERDAGDWSKNKFKELFVGSTVENELFSFKILEVQNCKGEASANNRKGKLIFFYEWELTLKWKAKLSEGKQYVKGKIVIPNFSEENEINEVDVDISINDPTDEGEIIKEVMHDLTTKKIRELLHKYIQSLKAEFSQGMILPSKHNADVSESRGSVNHKALGSGKKTQTNTNSFGAAGSTPSIQNSVGSSTMTTIELTQAFHCTAIELYNALTINEMVAAFTHGPVTLEAKEGGKFDLFGGNVSGEFIKLVPGSKIVQTWRYKRWPTDHYSIVTIDIIQQTDYTEFKLLQTGVPQEEVDGVRGNWQRYYIDALKSTFGFGCFL